ncbi:hypothetical protein [Terrabacter sp. 2RAF25]|uniref:hypothetical protein n=1 Tax=Terrabacter sp. 2RAF25 TaxID=3232998 RepID=UPI003F9B366B
MNARRITTAFAAVVAATALTASVAHANEPGEPGYYNDAYMPAACVGPVDRAKNQKDLDAEAREAEMLHTIQVLQVALRISEHEPAIK